MSPQDFCYWLQGFVEMADPKELNEDQVKMLKKHLNLVFTNVTSEPPAEKKEILTDAQKDRLRREIHPRAGIGHWEPQTYCAGTVGQMGVKLC